MPNFVFTRKAVKDLTDIWNYTYDNWSEQQADKYYQEILIECKSISINPNKGKKYFSCMSSDKSELLGTKNKRVFYKVT